MRCGLVWVGAASRRGGLVGWNRLRAVGWWVGTVSPCGGLVGNRLSVRWAGGLEPPLVGTASAGLAGHRRLGLGTWAARQSASAPTPVHTCCRPARGAGRPWRGRRGCPSAAAAMRASGDRRRRAGCVSRATAMPQPARRASRAGIARAPSRPAAPGEEQHRAGRAWAIALIAARFLLPILQPAPGWRARAYDTSFLGSKRTMEQSYVVVSMTRMARMPL